MRIVQRFCVLLPPFSSNLASETKTLLHRYVGAACGYHVHDIVVPIRIKPRDMVLENTCHSLEIEYYLQLLPFIVPMPIPRSKDVLECAAIQLRMPAYILFPLRCPYLSRASFDRAPSLGRIRSAPFCSMLLAILCLFRGNYVQPFGKFAPPPNRFRG